MRFLSPILLWFLAAAAIPVIIHLINRRRHKTIRWAAMQFLLKAARESRGRKKLRHILILTCRTLGIAALATAAARPIASNLLGWGGGSIDTVILLLDRSASMEIRPGDGLDSRRTLILRQVSSALQDLGNPRLILIDSASATPQEIPSPDTLAELSATAATDTTADFPSLLARAAERLADLSGRCEIWLASDMQASNWRPEDERWAAARASIAALPQKPTLRILSLTGSSAANAGIRLLQSRRSGNELLLDLEVTRNEDSRGTANLPLTTSLQGGKTTETLVIPGQSIRFQKRLALPPGEDSGHGWLSLPADGNPRDNAAFFAYGPARPTESLVVASPGEAADYLSLAAAPPGLDFLQTRRIDPAAFASHNTAPLALILWAAPLPAQGPAADSLRKFLSAGGQVLFLPPGNANTSAEFLGLTWSQVDEAPRGKFHILGEWNRSDGPMRDGIDGTPLPAERLRAILRQIPTGDAAPLARWEDGEPFLIRRITDLGTAWFLGSLPDYGWSNLGDADVLLPVVQRLLTQASERFDSAYLATVGTDAAKPLAGEIRVRLDDYGSPDPANADHEAGIYRLGERLLAVNRPVQEDSPELISKEALDAALDGLNPTLLEQASQSGDPTLARDVWRAFLLAMLFFLLAEALLCLPKAAAAVAAVSPPPSPARPQTTLP